MQSLQNQQAMPDLLLQDFTRDLPLNMSDDEVKGLLFAYPAEPLAYDDWLGRIGKQ